MQIDNDEYWRASGRCVFSTWYELYRLYAWICIALANFHWWPNYIRALPNLWCGKCSVCIFIDALQAFILINLSFPSPQSSLQNLCGEINFREYLVCALYLIKQSLPTIDLIESVSKMYDNCGKGPGRLTRTALHCILNQTMATSVDESVEFFTHADCDQSDFVTIGMYCSF